MVPSPEDRQGLAPRQAEAAAQYNDFRIHRCRDVVERYAQREAQARSTALAAASPLEAISKTSLTDEAGSPAAFYAPAQRRSRAKGFHTAASSTRAQRAILQDGNMTQLPGGPMAVINPAVVGNRAANAGSYGQHGDALETLAAPMRISAMSAMLQSFSRTILLLRPSSSRSAKSMPAKFRMPPDRTVRFAMSTRPGCQFQSRQFRPRRVVSPWP